MSNRKRTVVIKDRYDDTLYYVLHTELTSMDLIQIIGQVCNIDGYTCEDLENKFNELGIEYETIDDYELF